VPEYDVEIHLNETYDIGGTRAPALRKGTECALPSDYFAYLCTLKLTADSPQDALQKAFKAGTATGGDVQGSRTYDRYADRSMAVGDAVIVHTPPDGVLIAYVGAVKAEWVNITHRNDFNSITPGEPPCA
jgi:hypothetical protein